MRLALAGVNTLFLLVSNAPDELTQAINTLGLARKAGVQGIVYLSVTRRAEYTDVSHFTAKHAVEQVIEQMDLPATVLRPSYFFQNDATLKDPLTEAGLYVSPSATRACRWSMCATSRMPPSRDRAPAALPRETYELSGPDALIGTSLATIWSDALGRDVRYAGGYLDAFEKAVKTEGRPGWHATSVQ